MEFAFEDYKIDRNGFREYSAFEIQFVSVVTR